MADVDDPFGIIVGNIPDVPQTALAFRTWRLSEDGSRLLSINAPSLTGKAGGSGNQQTRKVPWIHRAMASDGQDGWPIGGPLVAHCGVHGANAEKNEDHGKIPAKGCSCGIYATTSIRVINKYLGNEIIQGTIAIRGPVLGIVELGGRVIPATQGFRAAFARVAAILLIDEAFSLSSARLKAIADFYRVPAITPHSKNPEDYREDIAQLPEMLDKSSIGDEAEQWLSELNTQEGQEGDEEEE
jgi:hypothetical protein